MKIEAAKITVNLEHPHGEVETTLAEWVRIGPGPRRLVRPIGARRSDTGEPVPLRVIPLRYRNHRWSRLLIALRVLDRPWPRAGG